MYVVMRAVVFVAALLLSAACGELQSGALAGGRATPTPAITPTPDVALRLMDRVRNMSAVVGRVDRIAAAQEKWGDILTRSGSQIQIPGANPNEDVWVVAVVGDVAPTLGLGRASSGAYQCATFVFDAQENGKSSTYGALSACARYFTDS